MNTLCILWRITEAKVNLISYPQKTLSIAKFLCNTPLCFVWRNDINLIGILFQNHTWRRQALESDDAALKTNDRDLAATSWNSHLKFRWLINLMPVKKDIYDALLTTDWIRSVLPARFLSQQNRELFVILEGFIKKTRSETGFENSKLESEKSTSQASSHWPTSARLYG